MKSSRPASAKCMSSKTRATGPFSAMRSKNVRHAPNSSSAAIPPSTPSSVSRERSIQSRSVSSVHPLGDGLLDPGARCRLVVAFAQSGTLADHLAQRPEGDAFAVRGRAAAVPVDGLHQAVDVDRELARQPALADPCRADDAHHAQPLLAAGGVEQVLDQPQLFLAADEWRLQRLRPFRPPRSATTRSARHAGTGDCFPLSSCSPAGSKCDGSDCRAVRRLAHQHRPGRRR